MVIFHSYVSLPEGKQVIFKCHEKTTVYFHEEETLL